MVLLQTLPPMPRILLLTHLILVWLNLGIVWLIVKTKRQATDSQKHYAVTIQDTTIPKLVNGLLIALWRTPQKSRRVKTCGMMPLENTPLTKPFYSMRTATMTSISTRNSTMRAKTKKTMSMTGLEKNGVEKTWIKMQLEISSLSWTTKLSLLRWQWAPLPEFQLSSCLSDQNNNFTCLKSSYYYKDRKIQYNYLMRHN